MFTSLETKIKNNIIDDFSAVLYRKLNITISDADNSFYWGGGHIYKIIDQVFKKYGPVGLSEEMKYIIQYLDFLFVKLRATLSSDKIGIPYSKQNDLEFLEVYFTYIYFLKYYRHYAQRKIPDPNQSSFGF
jgi:hypothetical protein